MDRTEIEAKIAEEALRACADYLGITATSLVACGSYGCVFKTTNPDQVIKIGMQWNEYHLAKYLLNQKNLIHEKFPKIYNAWNLDSCYLRLPLYAILRENLEDLDPHSINISWFNKTISTFEYKCERIFELMQKISESAISEIAKQILEDHPGNPQNEIEFIKFAEFYAECAAQNIILTDSITTNFGVRKDGTIVLRDLGGIYLP